RPRGENARVEAVSGSDVVEKRSNQVQLLRTLAQAVLDWGERLVFSGVKDDSLPPRVLKALDAYIAESHSRLLVVMPLRDEREGDPKDKNKKVKPPRSALVMECYEAPDDPPQTVGRLEVVAKHATSALYNSLELKRIPLQWLLLPFARLREGLGGQTRTIILLVVALLSLAGAALAILPYPLRVDSGGTVLPTVRRSVYPPVQATIKELRVQPSARVAERNELARMHGDSVWEKWGQLDAKIKGANTELDQLQARATASSGNEKRDLEMKVRIKAHERDSLEREMAALIERTGVNRNNGREFSLVAPEMTAREKALAGGRPWKVLTGNFQDMLDKDVRPNEPVMRLGVTEGPWEMELKIPQKHIGQVLKAFDRLQPGQPLEVDFLLKSQTATLYKGLLFRERIAGEATAGQDAASESEPVVIAYVEIEHPGIPEEYRVPRSALISTTEVVAKVNCGPHRAGYALFYGVWEFVYEKIVFFF
ncbi:MAG: hypothetical protein K2W96_20070, partial [Gemmataceae bacterium]|nr:hypothetical protein [Gemmataceae bacterium]